MQPSKLIPLASTTPQSAGAAHGSRAVNLAAALLLALFWWLAVSASAHWSQTSDELPHITAGYVYDRFGDYRMHSENGNLPQRVHGLAPLALGAQFPMAGERWRNSDYWQLGWDFLYSSGNDTDRMLLWARALNALFGVGLGFFIFRVAARHCGPIAGLTALGFYAFCPNFLAHSALATSDLAGTLCLTLAAWFFWRHLGCRDWRSGALAGLCSGLALVAKFNGVLLAPIYAALAVADAALRGGDGVRTARFGRNILLCLWQVPVGMMIIWAFFSFRFDVAGAGAPPLDKLAWDWDQMLGLIGWKAAFIRFATEHRLLPYGWIYGLTNVLSGAAARPAFLAGENSIHGWREFFPVLLLTKTPLSFLIAIALAGATGLWRWRMASPSGRRERLLFWTPLVVPAAIVFLTAVFSHLNIGHRHILAVYPVLFIAAGTLVTGSGLLRSVLCLTLVAGQVVESVRIRPHYLAFFNPIAGGPMQAYRLVADSSLDWGQGLPALRDWLAANRRSDELVYLSYFGSAWPPHYDVRPTHFLPAVNIATPPQQRYDYGAGLYCISATSLAEVYGSFPGPWRSGWEAQLRDPATDYDLYELLRFSRLCRYLQSRRPDAQAGYSILIYRLTDAEVAAALTGPVKGW